MNDTQSTATVKDRSQEFVSVEGSQETASASGLLVAAYIMMWFAVFLYVWLASKRVKALGSRIDDLESALRRTDEAQGASTAAS